MSWEKKRVLITVKAYPEMSRNHGPVVCTAGITEDGDFIRLYPINISHFIGTQKVSKYDWIEVECQKVTSEKLNRKESYRVRQDSIKIVDSDHRTSSNKWKKRWEVLRPKLSDSLESLKADFDEDRTSLGLIKPKDILKFYHTEKLERFEEPLGFQQTLEGQNIPAITKIPHIFKYKFKCGGCQDDKSHDIQCEDWELLEAYRKWGQKYRSDEELWNALEKKFYTWMENERDLHFLVGTYSLFPTWLIIGLYYPPKDITKPKGPKTTLNDFS